MHRALQWARRNPPSIARVQEHQQPSASDGLGLHGEVQLTGREATAMGCALSNLTKLTECREDSRACMACTATCLLRLQFAVSFTGSER